MLRFLGLFVPVWWSWMIFHRDGLAGLVLTVYEPPEG
jgi:hypothetical protein